jgi:C4-dicarboxylate-specific signal transduction histidine kinase
MMHLANGSWIAVVILVVMLGAFAFVDRYARRHPYGTGRVAHKERKQRAREAHLQRVEERSTQAKARNEAVMAEMIARLQPQTRPRSSESESDHPTPPGPAYDAADGIRPEPR